MIRIVLFLITNLAVMLLLGIIVKLFGVETYLAGQGVGMNLNALAIMYRLLPSVLSLNDVKKGRVAANLPRPIARCLGGTRPL